MDYSQATPSQSPVVSAPAQPQMQPMAAPQPQYYQQGQVALAPQYQPMGQVIPMAAYQAQSPAQPQPVESQRSASTTQELTSLVRDLVGLRQTSALLSPPQAQPLPPANYGAAAPQYQQPQYTAPQQYQPGYQPTYSTDLGYSQASPQDSQPVNANLTEHSLQLLQQLTTPDALASLNLAEGQIPASKPALHAYAIQLEDELGVVAGEYQHIAPLVEEGLILWQLLSDPQKFGGLTEVYLDQMLRTPGGYDHFLNAFMPIYDQVSAYRNQQQPPQQQVPQQQYVSSQPAPQQYVQSLPPQQETQYVWGDGARPQAREVGVDAGLPPQAGATGVNLAGVPPDQLWRRIDQMQQDGSIRGLQLVG
jgi:hypothetical protein